jgi:hypothetical protein
MGQPFRKYPVQCHFRGQFVGAIQGGSKDKGAVEGRGSSPAFRRRPVGMDKIAPGANRLDHDPVLTVRRHLPADQILDLSHGLRLGSRAHDGNQARFQPDIARPNQCRFPVDCAGISSTDAAWNTAELRLVLSGMKPLDARNDLPVPEDCPAVRPADACDSRTICPDRGPGRPYRVRGRR